MKSQLNHKMKALIEWFKYEDDEDLILMLEIAAMTLIDAQDLKGNGLEIMSQILCEMMQELKMI